jgi:peroxiredoxin
MDPVARVDHPSPDFELSDLQGVRYRLTGQRGKIMVLVFWSAACPWSEYADAVLADVESEFDQKLEIWRIASNAGENPQAIREVLIARGLSGALLDADQRVADLYEAITTPHAFVVDAKGILRYRGAVDDATFRYRTPTKTYLRNAITAVLEGRLPEVSVTPGYGCAIVRHVE